eukprot:Phypoly_transcript_02585.p1 GENE.Phypoly_transcript_02585~~Phypoly_transcript_02585.p1  ORF type:complete len:676 (+),score=112.05 Phypoly_transcript_02585:73-2100(+)
MRVLVRIRPLQEDETPSQCLVPVGKDCIRLVPPLSDESIRVTRVYPKSASQVTVFEESLFPVVAHVINGGNGTVIAYGPTGTGKRYSIEGTPLHPGLLPFSLLSIFTYKNEHAPEDLVVSVSWYEIHAESVLDLFCPGSEENKGLRIVDRGQGKGLGVQGLTVLQISSPEEAFELINNVQLDYDRQSHTVFSIHVSHKLTCKEGSLSFVVMVGSEQALGSLANFRLIIESLYNRQPQIPFHKSKLTLILKESLSSPNVCTTLICTVSPSHESTFDTSATLTLASQAVHVNPKADKELNTPQWNYRPRLSCSPQIQNNFKDTFQNNNQPSDYPQSYDDPDNDQFPEIQKTSVAYYYNNIPQDSNISDTNTTQYNTRSTETNNKQNNANYYNTSNRIPDNNITENNKTHITENKNVRNMEINRQKNFSEYYNDNNFAENNIPDSNNEEIKQQEHFHPNNRLVSPREPSPSTLQHSTSSHSLSGSDFRGDNKKLALLKNNNKDTPRRSKTTNYLTPQSPKSTSSTTPSPPSFRFALTASPPTPRKEKAPSANDSTVEVQKLRMQLQKALQEINGFKIYKDVIDKNIVALRDSLSSVTDAKAICEKELKAKEIQLRKKNKEIESLNKSLKDAVMQAERATKDKMTIKLRADELDKVEAQRMKMIEEAMEQKLIQSNMEK